MSNRDLGRRIAEALNIAHDGCIDGGHHKMWVIDQMVRALTGCPMVKLVSKFASTPDGKGFMDYEYEGYGESEEYAEWVKAHCHGPDGPSTYEWDSGIAP